MGDAPPDVLAEARALVAAGFSVIPIDTRTKQPYFNLLPKDPKTGKATWNPFRERLPTEAELTRWFDPRAHRGAAGAMALACGPKSDGVLCLDFDVVRFFDDWMAYVGTLADGLVIQKTGGGRRQVFFRCPAPGPNTTLAWMEDESQESGRTIAIETRGDGGYACLPPSLHPSGGRYQWISGNLLSIPRIPQAHADALLAAARKLDECPHTKQERDQIEAEARNRHEQKAKASRNGSANIIGQFNERHSLTSLLETHGYTEAPGGRYCRPCREGIGSISVRDGRSVHFSTNDPLNDGKVRSGIGVHDAFDVYAQLEHGGDVRAAVKAAARSMNLDPAPATGGGAAKDGAWMPAPNQIVESPEPMRLAEHYLRSRRTQCGHLTLRRFREQWWLFERGGYCPLPDELALVDVYKHVDQLWTPVRDKETGEPTGLYKKIIARSSTVGEVAKAIPACGAMVDGEMPQWLDSRGSPEPADVVAFHNGLLDTATWCRGGGGLLPLTPLWFGGVACPYGFDPAAVCPNWLAFLHQTFDGDAESTALLQEWFGLNLVPDNRFERLMMFVGPPRSGKGTVLEVQGAMLGEGQAAITSFTKLASRFGLAPLVGKLAAILPDAHIGSGTDAKGALEVLKSITGNDPQGIDRKGIDELPRVRLLNRFTIAVNELPKLPDEAGALKTRLLLLHFRNSHAGKEDTALKPRLKAEAPGVAVWALQGLQRLRAQGRFTMPQRSAVMIEAFEKIVSPVLGFLDDRCEMITGDEGVWVEKDELYRAWCDWSKDRGSDPGNKADFGQALLNANKGVAVAKRGPRGQQFPVYTGVRPCN